MKIGDLVKIRGPEINSQMRIWHPWMGHIGVIIDKNPKWEDWPAVEVLIQNEVLDFYCDELEQML